MLALSFAGVFNMPPKRLLSHYKLDARRNRLLTVSCNAEDMLLPRSNFTFHGEKYLSAHLFYKITRNGKIFLRLTLFIPDRIRLKFQVTSEARI